MRCGVGVYEMWGGGCMRCGVGVYEMWGGGVGV